MAAPTGQTHDCIPTAIIAMPNTVLDRRAPSTHDAEQTWCAHSRRSAALLGRSLRRHPQQRGLARHTFARINSSSLPNCLHLPPRRISEESCKVPKKTGLCLSVKTQTIKGRAWPGHCHARQRGHYESDKDVTEKTERHTVGNGLFRVRGLP